VFLVLCRCAFEFSNPDAFKFVMGCVWGMVPLGPVAGHWQRFEFEFLLLFVLIEATVEFELVAVGRQPVVPGSLWG
jgi:hypothetical protein